MREVSAQEFGRTYDCVVRGCTDDAGEDRLCRDHRDELKRAIARGRIADLVKRWTKRKTQRPRGRPRRRSAV